MTPRTTHAAARRGFSLVELLTVLAILSILVALTASGVIKTIDYQHRSNTSTLLNKVHGELSKQWTATLDTAKGETPSPTVVSMAGGDPERAKVIWIKFRLKQEFPMSYAEALNPGGGVVPIVDLPSRYARDLGGRTNANNPLTESAACLLLALKKTRRGTGFNAEQAFGASAMKDTDGDGLPELVDSWGTAVFFYRWGTGSLELDQLGGARTSNLTRDREDPGHTLMNMNWNSSAGATQFAQLLHAIRYNNAPYSWYTEPTVVSAGGNRLFGLDGTMAVVNGQDASDNLYTFRLR